MDLSTLAIFFFSLPLLAVAGISNHGNCIEHDAGLSWLSTKLSSGAVITCRSPDLASYESERYWGLQYSKEPAVLVLPASTQDVSYTVQAARKTKLGNGYAIVGGGHSMTNASSSYSFVIDLRYLNDTHVVDDMTKEGDGTGKDVTGIAYGGGSTSQSVQTALNGTGWTAVSARVGSVGMGGFSTGGGIGFIAGAYGFATDRLIALEVVLTSGEVVFATKQNQYADLFWSFQGGAGQAGIVTTFYQEAAPTPRIARIGFNYISEDTVERSFQNTVDFFNNHDDPFSLFYYGFGYLPADLSNPNPKPSDFKLVNLMTTVWFEDPTKDSSQQQSYEDTFKDLLDGVNATVNIQYSLPYANLTVIGESFFPYGFRRGFWGPQLSNVTVPYMRDAGANFKSYIDSTLANGDFPGTSTWILQYQSPGLNGNLPKSDHDTAWPHSMSGHQTLFDPGWSNATSDGIANAANDVFNDITYAQQARFAAHGSSLEGFIENLGAKLETARPCGGIRLCDYPNYIGPNVPGHQVWGENIPKLIEVKQKYDPECRLSNGRVFATWACVAKGVANVFP